MLALLLAVAGAGAWWYAGKPLPGASTPKGQPVATDHADRPRGGPPGEGPPDGPRRGRPADTGPVRVAVGTVGRGDVPVYVSGLGVVTAMRSATIRPQVEGILQEIYFKEGQPVRKDEPLARIDPRPYEAALRKAVADVEQNKAQAVAARQSLDRQKLLGSRDIASKETIETAQAKLGQMDAAVDAAVAAAERARIDLDNTLIRAPWNGLAGMRAIDEGNMVRTGDASGLVVLAQVDPIAVVFTLPADSLPPAARNPSAAKGVVSLLGRDRKTETAQGELTAVDNLIDQNTNAIKLKAVFANGGYTLWPGQFVTARLAVDTIRNAVTAPAAAVQRGPDGTYAFVVRAGEHAATVEQRPVVVDLVQDDIAVVRSGLEPGERVVVEGQYRLKNGSAVVPADGEKPDPAALASGVPPS